MGVQGNVGISEGKCLKLLGKRLCERLWDRCSPAIAAEYRRGAHTVYEIHLLLGFRVRPLSIVWGQCDPTASVCSSRRFREVEVTVLAFEVSPHSGLRVLTPPLSGIDKLFYDFIFRIWHR